MSMTVAECLALLTIPTKADIEAARQTLKQMTEWTAFTDKIITVIEDGNKQ